MCRVVCFGLAVHPVLWSASQGCPASTINLPLLSTGSNRWEVATSTDPGHPAEDCPKISSEEKAEEENGGSDGNGNGPVSPLPNFHVTDVTGVHAEDARDG